MKEEEENQGAYTAWISEDQKILSFQKMDGYEKVSFSSHEDKFAFVIKKCESGYRIQ